LVEPALEPKEFTIHGYRDGSRFGAHLDTSEQLARVRVLSCVYYFAVTPRRFSGGELRLYGLPTLSSVQNNRPPAFVDIVPETDTLVVFPSWLCHEVLPVHVPSGAWLDGRFTINCWLHRVAPPAGNLG
jgi:Rps23 Pro-64 3,4-dihydroxylase Tpa1-like proline 4-hydroxylase